MKTRNLILAGIVVVFLLALKFLPMTSASEKHSVDRDFDSLLSDPFLQLPTENSVNVVWFTEFAGDKHWVKYGEKLEQKVIAKTSKLSRVREDRDSQLDNPPSRTQSRNIWRHEATVNNLILDKRIAYQVQSVKENKIISSNIFTLTTNPSPNKPVKILLTSDHQLMPMTAANLSKVKETIDTIDAVFLAGDLVNIPDRASEWFDDRRGGAFFPSLQGKANYELEHNGTKTIYHGGEIIQHAPLFPALGNHEVMGQMTQPTLKEEFNQPIPREVAQRFYQYRATGKDSQLDGKSQAEWIKDNSFNSDTYEEIFSLPQSQPGGKKYYAVTYGNIRLISLYVTNIWRTPNLAAEEKGRFQESNQALQLPEDWVCGANAIDPATGYPNLSNCRIYKPIWRVILDWFK